VKQKLGKSSPRAKGMAPNTPAEIQLPSPGFYKLPLAAKCSSLINTGESISFQLQLSNATFVRVELSAEAAQTLYSMFEILSVDHGETQGNA